MSVSWTKTSAILLASLLFVASTAEAAIVLDFEGLQDSEAIENFYNGGTGSLGSGPGTNYGINFGSDSLAIISNTAGGTGNFSNNPSGDTIAFFLTGLGDIMNVPAGFDTGFSFFYAGLYDGSVTVYDGLNATGNVLATLPLPPTANPYTEWVPVGVAFAGTAQSVSFSGVANYIGFDDITLGSETPGDVVPEPGSIVAWSLLGLCAGVYKLRRNRA